jgi:hypothetical protein
MDDEEDVWRRVEEEKRIAASYLKDHRSAENPSADIEEWNPPGAPIRTWSKNWISVPSLYQSVVIGFGAIFAAAAVSLLSGRNSNLAGAVVLFVVVLVLLVWGIGPLFLPLRRIEYFSDGTFVFSRGRKAIVVRAGELRSISTIAPFDVWRWSPMWMEAHTGHASLAPRFSDMQYLSQCLRRENPEGVISYLERWG